MSMWGIKQAPYIWLHFRKCDCAVHSGNLAFGQLLISSPDTDLGNRELSNTDCEENGSVLPLYLSTSFVNFYFACKLQPGVGMSIVFYGGRKHKDPNVSLKVLDCKSFS